RKNDASGVTTNGNPKLSSMEACISCLHRNLPAHLVCGFFFSSRRRHTRFSRDWSSDVCSSDLAGKSTNIELVNQITKLGGNGPIMANALAGFGMKVTYLGNLGYPHLHPVFHEFARRAEVYSIAEPGHTDALEFDDGKIMLGKHSSLKEVNWTNILARFGRDKFATQFEGSDLIAFV